MKRESFYLEIGNIDDDLICEAENARGYKNRRSYVYYFAGIAACLCLICGGMLYSTQRDVIRYNTATISASSKVVIPEGTTMRNLTYAELLDYYGLQEFPDTLSGLCRTGRSVFSVYENAGDIIFDENVLQYASADGQQTVTVTIATDEYCVVSDKSAEKSRIDGMSLVLAVSENAAGKSGEYLYRAEIFDEGVYLRVVSYGMDEEEFIKIVRELIKSQK